MALQFKTRSDGRVYVVRRGLTKAHAHIISRMQAQAARYNSLLRKIEDATPADLEGLPADIDSSRLPPRLKKGLFAAALKQTEKLAEEV